MREVNEYLIAKDQQLQKQYKTKHAA